ncbi:filamentous hemagglutinin [mine drainage metagenome]|uniref:Filamentous hemagglutinin n=1 Tax=mine drainage metagenome TaxID=410659 RepID=A0A1J5S1U0_9ZZZZ
MPLSRFRGLRGHWLREEGEEPEMRLGMYCSGALHVIAALIAIFGLPHLMSEPPQVTDAVVVELAPVAEKTNAPPKRQQQPKAEEKPAEPEKVEAPPIPEPKPEPPTPEPPKPSPPPPPPPPQPPEPPPPEPKPPEPTPAPVPDAPAPKPPPPKPAPPKPERPKESKPVKKRDTFDALMDSALNTLDKSKPASHRAPSPQPQNTPAASKITSNSSSWDPTQPVSMAEKDYIAAQFRKCWNFDPGARDAASLVVRVHVLLNSDGGVIRGDIVSDPRYYSDSYYRAAADSARRAVYACQPIKIPPGKYDALKDLILTFDPRDALQ